jgi:ABC-type Mn2+/Zn2+ transport system permease subunit
VPTGAGWLANLIGDAASATAGRGTIIALALAAVSGLIAFAVARDWHMRGFLWVSIAVAAVFWVFGQGLGGVLTGQATDVNTGPLLILLAGILLGAARITHERHRSPRRERLPVAADGRC